MPWNTFFATTSSGKMRLFTGDGNYEQNDVCQYIIRVLDRDYMMFENHDHRHMALAQWKDGSYPSSFMYTVAISKVMGMVMFGVYKYHHPEMRVADIESLVRDLPTPVILGMGLNRGHAIVSHDTRNEILDTMGDLDMRISLLYKEIGFPRATKNLTEPGGILDRDDAITHNWEALKGIHDLPVADPRHREEAAHLIRQIGMLRMDLQKRNLEDGIA